jgi:thioredoxin-related protein
MRSLPACLIVSLCIALASCAKLANIGKNNDEPASPFGPTGIPPQLRARGPAGDGTPVTAPNSQPSNIELTPEEDIVFTDPDNPDADLPELANLLAAAPKRRGPWEESETIAKKRAAREGKPLLIWFTDTESSPMCKAINQELFTNPEFEEWADDKIIRLRVDANVRSNPLVKDPSISVGEAMSREVDLNRYVTRLKKQYKVLGQPALRLLNPSGEVIGRYNGYKRGQSDYYWGLIKQGEAASAHAYQSWRANLEKKGYREWTDRRDRKVFARLVAYSKGTLTLIEPDGTRSRTHEDKLSDHDQQWIRDQKKLRNLD